MYHVVMYLLKISILQSPLNFVTSIHYFALSVLMHEWVDVMFSVRIFEYVYMYTFTVSSIKLPAVF